MITIAHLLAGNHQLEAVEIGHVLALEASLYFAVHCGFLPLFEDFLVFEGLYARKTTGTMMRQTVVRCATSLYPQVFKTERRGGK